MKILLFGSRGFIGKHFMQLYPGAVVSDIDIAEPDQVREALDTHKPDIVINAAGKTGRPNIDWCEDHREETLRANVTGPLILLHECSTRNIYWVHCSSGCIYEGDNGGRGYAEEDAPNFTGSFYSRTKALLDQLLLESATPPLIVRFRMPFDASGNPRSLLTKLKNFEKVLDVQNSYTCIPDFLLAVESLITERETGIFNIVNPGTLSPYQIMQIYADHIDSSHTFERLLPEEAEFATKVRRSNCVLSTEKLQKKGIQLRPIREAVLESLSIQAVSVQ
jgi:3,5-epimerase/4-reductase